MVKIGMDFTVDQDFGSIERYADNRFQLLSTDISKLNGMLTKSYCQPYLANGQFNIFAGTTAVILDTPAVYQYHAGMDTWYEVIPVDE